MERDVELQASISSSIGLVIRDSTYGTVDSKFGPQSRLHLNSCTRKSEILRKEYICKCKFEVGTTTPKIKKKMKRY